MSAVYDYVIAGAGSAGCVLANRLSEDPSVTVCLIEAGGSDKKAVIRTPMLLQFAITDEAINWNYWTEPQRHLHGRKLYWPRGKTLGGSSSINAMHYMRGAWENYDEWEQVYGAQGWGREAALEAFTRVENNENHGAPWHGKGGPLNVKTIAPLNPLTERYYEACRARQIPENPDHNGERQEGFGPYQVTQKGGKRCSAADAFLRPALKRPNLTVITGALARRIVIEEGRATGLEIEVEGEVRVIEAAREVIASGGAINSPQLLMLSGIGPGDHLREHGISVEADLPGVGANLQDHLDIMARASTRKPTSIGYSLQKLPATARDVLQWALTGTGPFTVNPVQGCGFVKSSRARDLPDIQLVFIPARGSPHGRETMTGHGIMVHACHLYPQSRGSLRLASADPSDPVLIDPNYMDHEEDAEVMTDCLEIARDILLSDAFDGEFRELELPAKTDGSRAELLDHVRANAETLYHPTSTCAMGSGELAVTDPQCRVRGVKGLRVVDASVMPRLVGGNTNAPTMMIATRAADMIIADRS
ncbi:glucose-methanol-choline oxidoreductase [Alkalicaulis satelles]|uniref:Glucose-methanol-choline oxidoreductase n=1 Tax=Alkalicaulis satelles TaxID=2609175 RepID=A0A5M6ZHD0_9PROT|nr:GMC family oxidoreductase N-terminal domain-containing protein [Alkalicaulis satelles]KAA5803700.1 glucose-methanol-choline oxidoreductase [Alkalicaulis satelles]